MTQKSSKTCVTAEEIREYVRYEPETGNFFRTKLYNNRGRLGARCDVSSGKGYRRVTIAKKRYYAHQLAWFLTYGEWPEYVDHVNGDRADNRITNLRKTTVRANGHNMQVHRRGQPPAISYQENCPNHPWRVKARKGEKVINIANVETRKQAEKALEDWLKENDPDTYWVLFGTVEERLREAIEALRETDALLDPLLMEHRNRIDDNHVVLAKAKEATSE